MPIKFHFFSQTGNKKARLKQAGFCFGKDYAFLPPSDIMPKKSSGQATATPHQAMLPVISACPIRPACTIWSEHRNQRLADHFAFAVKQAHHGGSGHHVVHGNHIAGRATDGLQRHHDGGSIGIEADLLRGGKLKIGKHHIADGVGAGSKGAERTDPRGDLGHMPLNQSAALCASTIGIEAERRRRSCRPIAS